MSFNSNEATAVESFLSDLAGFDRSWVRVNAKEIAAFTNPRVTIRHVPVQAQGNAIAAGALASFFAGSQPEDFVVFYGCAGALDPANVGAAYLVSSVSYVSLGTVESQGNSERVTLKNKWLCHTDGDVQPLPAIEFPLAVANSATDLATVAGLSRAHVLATDKVIRVSAATGPTPTSILPPHQTYKRSEWSYGESFGYFAGAITDRAQIIDMESYGVGLIARALTIENRVAILRITTDDLVTHAASDADQFSLLMRGRVALARLIHTLLNPAGGLP